MRTDGDMDIQVAVLRARPARLAFARQPDPCAVFHARRNRHRQAALPLDRAGALADATWIADHPTLAGASGTGSFDQKEALLCPNLARALAGRACLRRPSLVL